MFLNGLSNLYKQAKFRYVKVIFSRPVIGQYHNYVSRYMQLDFPFKITQQSERWLI